VFLPFFTLLVLASVQFRIQAGYPCCWAIEIGIGLLYKSFALLAPSGWCWPGVLHQGQYRWREFLFRDDSSGG